MRHDSTSTVLAALNTAIPNGSLQEINSTHDYLDRVAGERITKTITLSGAGAQSINIFELTGWVEAYRIFALCTEATGSATFQACSWELYDGTASLPITAAAGTDCSGIAVGGGIVKDDTAAAALTFVNNSAGRFTDGGGAGYYTTLCPFRVMKKTGVSTYIRFKFTGAAPTDVDMKFYVDYFKLSDDGALAAV